MPVPLPETPARALRRAGWLAGLPVLGLIWAAATLTGAPEIAARIAAEGTRIAAQTGTATGEPWLRVSALGRDLVALGEAPDVAERASVLADLDALDGPRRVVSEVGLVETAAPFVWSATRTGPATVSVEGSRPVEVGRRALEVQVTGALGPGTGLDDGARAARGAPPDFPGAAAFLVARLPGLATGGRASVSDTVISLAGEAVDVPAYDALRAALARPPEGYSIGHVEVLPPRVADWRFVLDRSASGIVLDGYAVSETVRREAVEAARVVAEGGFVDDRLHTARGLPKGIDPAELVAFMGRLAGLIQAGRVAYADGAVSVAGDAADPQAIPEAQALMEAGRPAGVSAGPVTLAARPLSPYRVTIRRDLDDVGVGGHLPDAETRERVLAALRPRLFRQAPRDRTRLADGAPRGLAEAIEAAAPMLLALASGEIAVSDRTLTLTGESLYRESAARAPERLAAALPPGWTGRASVLARQPAETREPQACREGVSTALAGADLRFPAGSATLAPSFYPALDAVAALARVCPALRIAVSGPADPPRPRTELAPGSAQAAPGGAPATQAAPGAAKSGPAKPGADKADPAKPAAAARKGGPVAKADPAARAQTPRDDEPPADLARQRALVLVEYLLQAGARPDQVSAGPDGAAGRAAAFALLP